MEQAQQNEEKKRTKKKKQSKRVLGGGGNIKEYCTAWEREPGKGGKITLKRVKKKTIRRSIMDNIMKGDKGHYAYNSQTHTGGLKKVESGGKVQNLTSF